MGLLIGSCDIPTFTSKLIPGTARRARLQAAVRWPEITVLAAIGCAIIAAVRTAALALVMAKYTPGSGKATMVSTGACMAPRMCKSKVHTARGHHCLHQAQSRQTW